ncbi:hypothetical protein QWY85_01855 [Neolewinella lacunae]|uniref:6-bladed beta-propeller n=1 Tax=Neolewinella lacunae TaxID=1517758 RepID=A0A923PPQ5_9BACT|nr:hypothetical protein [Neolewinella lacunae]MBC6994447.1 hypothetical protein [Neolewinella lacunae]MDN3633383.1 hypothetical protein [Neolewinella lacunae]
MKSCTLLPLFLALLFSCTAEPQDEVALNSRDLSVYEIDNSQTLPVADVNDYFELTSITIDPATSLKLGGTIDKFVLIGDTLIVCARRKGVVTALSSEGEIYWQLIANAQDFNIFSTIGLFDYNKFTKLIEISDYTERSFYYFSSDGSFHHRESSEIDFMDRAHLTPSVMVYDIFDFNNTHLIKDEKRYKYLRTTDGENLTPLVPMPLWQEGVVPIGGFDNFSEYKDQILHHSDLYDTIFLVQETQVQPFSVVTLKRGGSTQSVMEDSRIPGKLQFVMDENMPWITQAIPEKDRLFTSYVDNFSRFFSIIDQSKGVQLNSRLLKIEDATCIAPYSYWNGYWLSKTSPWELEFFKSLEAAGTPIDETVVKSFFEQRQNRDDLKGETFYLLKML